MLYGLQYQKNVFVGIKTLKLGVFDSVSCFNEGYIITKCQVLQRRGLKPGSFMVTAMQDLDAERIRNSPKGISDYEREARRKRLSKRKLEEEYNNLSDYETGMY